jgi:ADP-ribose pyrophosphatase YjhB (NUDIX family)
MNCIKNDRTVYVPRRELAAGCAVMVASILEVNQKFLMVERTMNAMTQLSLPQGRLRPGQGIGHCAATRVESEAGFTFVPTHLIGIYESCDDEGAITCIRVALTGKSITRMKTDPANREYGVVTNRWMTMEQVAGERESLESQIAHRCLMDYRAGDRYPLNIFRMPIAGSPKKTAANLAES